MFYHIKNTILLNKKKILFFLSIIISFFCIISIMLGLYAQNKSKYTFYTDDINDGVYIKDLYIGDSIVKLEDYDTDVNTFDQIKQKILLSRNENYILNISKIDNLKLSFENTSNDIILMKVKKSNKIINTIKIYPNSTYIFMDNTGTLAIIYSIISSFSLFEYILYISLFLLFSLIVYLSLIYINNFVNDLITDKFKIKKFIISVFLLFAINLMYIFPLMQIYKFLALIPMFVFLTIFIFIFYKKKVDKLHNYYILLTMFIGILFVLVLPPLHIPDEFSHFMKAYQTSFVFQEKNEVVKDATYVYLPEDFRNFIIKYDSQTLNYHFKMHPRTYFDDLFKATNYAKLSKNLTWYSLKYNTSFPYWLGTIMSFVARLTRMPVIILYYLSKLLCFIISTLMCYLAIKIVPKFKKIFFLVPLLPIFIQQAFGINVDWLTNCTFILLLAYIIKEIYNQDEMNNHNLKIIIILSIILGFCKFGYFPIALSILLISNKKKNKKRNYLKYFIMAIIVLMPILIMLNYKLMMSRAVTPAPRNLIPMTTLIMHPKMLLGMLIRTFAIRLDLDLFRGQITGFGWSTIWLNDFFLFIGMTILMALILCEDKDNIQLTKKQKIIFSIIFVLICGNIYAAMLLDWTEQGATSIDGLQPRYFIPPIMLLYILLQNKFVKINFKDRYLFYSLSVIILAFLALSTIILKIYM
ncbi:MAG: DUF2142 domain-containing protein [Bacilli bacterium]|nr:DUF2142 domain-containing protein [Bacilli bacterium]